MEVFSTVKLWSEESLGWKFEARKRETIHLGIMDRRKESDWCVATRHISTLETADVSNDPRAKSKVSIVISWSFLQII